MLKETQLLPVLMACALLLFAAHLCGALFRRLGLPRVGGEIAGGVLLGASGLARWAPELQRKIFFAFESQQAVLGLVYWAGLVLYMFCAGQELRPSASREDRRLVGWLTMGALVLPFAAGWFATPMFVEEGFASAGGMAAFGTTVGIAFAVTSIPVLSKILMDLDLLGTRLATLSLSVAVIEDIVLWIALAFVLSLAQNDQNLTLAFGHSLVTLLFFVFSFTILHPMFAPMGDSSLLRSLHQQRHRYLTGLLAFHCAVCLLLGISPMLAALLAGVAYALSPESLRYGQSSIRSITQDFFAPLYFAIVGFRIDLVNSFDWKTCGLLLLLSCLAKSVSLYLAGRLGGEKHSSALDLAVTLNARGGPGIVLASVAREHGVIGPKFELALILLALLSSILAGVWLGVLSRTYRRVSGTTLGQETTA